MTSSLEARQDLLGHKSGRITTHYSTAELQPLLNAVSHLCDRQSSSPTLLSVREDRKFDASSRKIPARDSVALKNLR